MPHITRDLLRKRAEHNEGMISTLEEISLHQEEIEGINEVLGATCRKLKILYLQNNIIPKMENLNHLKELEYLNLALNNITKIEGLQNCEFLKKLDLTVNFVDLDELEASINHLVPRDRFREFYMMGNPSQVNWPGFDSYVIAKLPQIDMLDGKEVTRSMRIQALQRLPQLEGELRELAAAKRVEKAQKQLEKQALGESNKIAKENSEEGEDSNKEELTENTPEVRMEIYKELAQQKREKEERENINKPRQRDYEKEHQDSLSSIRSVEEQKPEEEIRQKNEAGLTFTWDEESKKGFLLLEVYVQRFLDSSLIDVDMHPTYISIVIKGKLLRLKLPCEVIVSESKCQRSKTTGHLVVTMPKVNQKELTVSFSKPETKKLESRPADADRVRKIGTKKASIHDMMMQEALAASGSTSEKKPANSPEFLEIGSASARSGTDFTKIVRKPKETTEESAVPATVFATPAASSLIAELD